MVYERIGSVALEVGWSKIWRVYARRNKGEKRKGEVAVGITELPKV